MKKNNSRTNSTTQKLSMQNAKNDAIEALKSKEKLNQFIIKMEPFIKSCAYPYITIVEQYEEDMLN